MCVCVCVLVVLTFSQATFSARRRRHWWCRAPLLQGPVTSQTSQVLFSILFSCLATNHNPRKGAKEPVGGGIMIKKGAHICGVLGTPPGGDHYVLGGQDGLCEGGGKRCSVSFCSYPSENKEMSNQKASGLCGVFHCCDDGEEAFPNRSRVSHSLIVWIHIQQFDTLEAEKYLIHKKNKPFWWQNWSRFCFLKCITKF